MINGKKVRLRAIEREDIPKFVRWLNDPEVTQYLTLYMPISRVEEERWFEQQLESQNSKVLAIETNEGLHIGNIGLHDIDWKNRHAMLGIFIGEKEYWGLGYGTDAVMTLLGFAFQEMNLHRIYLYVFDYNERAIRCYQKCGFQVEGRQREGLYQNGEYHDLLSMSILESEYRAHQEAAPSDTESATPKNAQVARKVSQPRDPFPFAEPSP